MRYHLMSNAFLVKVGKEFPNVKGMFISYRDNQTEYLLEYQNEERTKGILMVNKNGQFMREPVDFIQKGTYIMMFCGSIQYVARWKAFFAHYNSDFEIVKHPFGESVPRYEKEIKSVFEEALDGEITSFLLDSYFGSKIIFRLNDVHGENDYRSAETILNTKTLDYYTNGHIHFGMNQEESYILMVMDTLIALDKWSGNMKIK